VPRARFIEDAVPASTPTPDRLALELALTGGHEYHPHAPSTGSPIGGLRAEDQKLTATIHDHTAPFNPRILPRPMTSDLLARRRRTGLVLRLQEDDGMHYPRPGDGQPANAVNACRFGRRNDGMTANTPATPAAGWCSVRAVEGARIGRSRARRGHCGHGGWVRRRRRLRLSAGTADVERWR
jgi:hypothetical protein